MGSEAFNLPDLFSINLNLEVHLKLLFYNVSQSRVSHVLIKIHGFALMRVIIKNMLNKKNPS